MTKMRKPNQPYFASFDEEVRHRKLWTIRGTYLTPKVQRHMENALNWVVLHERSGHDGVETSLMIGDAAGQCLVHKGIAKRLGPDRLKGGSHLYMFTPIGWEIFNIWRARNILHPTLTHVIINGQDVVTSPSFTTMK